MLSERTGVVVLGHGSSNPRGQEVITATAARYAATHPEYDVRYGFVEMASPQLEETITSFVFEGIRKIIVVPLFLSFGHHIATDLPKRMQLMAMRYPDVNLITTQPIGADPLLCDIIQARIENCEQV